MHRSLSIAENANLLFIASLTRSRTIYVTRLEKIGDSLNTTAVTELFETLVPKEQRARNPLKKFISKTNYFLTRASKIQLQFRIKLNCAKRAGSCTRQKLIDLHAMSNLSRKFCEEKH